MKSRSYLWYFLFALLFSIQVLPRLGSYSLTNDEPLDISNGYFYLTQGDVFSQHHHPPLSKALEAMPLLTLRLNQPQGATDAIDRAYAFFLGTTPAN